MVAGGVGAVVAAPVALILSMATAVPISGAIVASAIIAGATAIVIRGIACIVVVADA